MHHQTPMEFREAVLLVIIFGSEKKKKQYLGMNRPFHIITIALDSYWQTVTEMRATLRKEENYCFGGNWHLSMDEDEGGGNQLTQDA